MFQCGVDLKICCGTNMNILFQQNEIERNQINDFLVISLKLDDMMDPEIDEGIFQNDFNKIKNKI